MEYNNQVAAVDDEDDEEIEIPSSTSLSFSLPPPAAAAAAAAAIRGSAFSKPILPPSSSLISPRGAGGGGGRGTGTSAAKNVSLSVGSITPSSLHPTTAAAMDDHSSRSAVRNSDPAASVGGATETGSKAAAAPANASVRYRECLRNHAAAVGGHVLDGCGEFMPEGDDEAAPEALKCAACGCHRSFHRKEADGDAEAAESYYRAAAAAARVPLLLPPPPHPQGHYHHQKQFQFAAPATPSSGVVAFASASGGTTTESSSEERINATGVPTPADARRKRFRTKFTVEQKEKMLAFAERVGWRFQKQDEALVEQFCAEVGVRRHVLKVWMHNNKHLIRKQQLQQPAAQQDELLLDQHHQQHQPHSSQQ